MTQVRTRFAPSPTGFLHIGGLRTALFSYLFARHNHGTFILRIEDTDRRRYVAEALDDIIDSLSWAGIHWDEGPDIDGPYGPYLQSARKALYQEYAEKLIQAGTAYKCFCTPERLAELRETQKKKGFPIGYDRHCRDLPHAQIKEYEAEKRPYVIRLKVPLSGETFFDDAISGHITVKNTMLDDLILLKSDGYPTYHLSNVVDDHLMQITHVIRGNEWISSTPRHIILYNAFGWQTPTFAHAPVILAQGGGKLSKRHGATTVREFREKGYCKEALINFIALLGWSYDDKAELFTMEKLIENFTLERVNKSSAIFSYDKLDWFNGLYIRQKTEEELFLLIIPYLTKANFFPEEKIQTYKPYIISIIPLIKERIRYLSEAPEQMWFFFDDVFEIREANRLIPKKLDKIDTIRVLHQAIEVITTIDPFVETNIEHALRMMVEELNFKIGQVFMPLRIALTGTHVSPGLFETMVVLGKKRVIARLQNALQFLS